MLKSSVAKIPLTCHLDIFGMGNERLLRLNSVTFTSLFELNGIPSESALGEPEQEILEKFLQPA